ncbi:LysR family transcriptional regulator [Raoultibacter phocaeensis]|uniref:LysR family transcriptional regulator n=1 Tax=Raoultibacter phocaeensis TaxID=2479841 RepID=UPI0015D578F2|nr:LysR family transcriptional regulator [Raoultibacter phocaeensis]
MTVSIEKRPAPFASVQKPLTIRQIEYFVTVVELGSLTAAAEKNDITVQGISQAMADLERETGVRLLTRCKAGSTPTALGAEFYAKAKELLVHYAELDSFARSCGRGCER